MDPETHAHADHSSAAPYLKQKLGGRIAIGEHICQVQQVFGKLFNAGTEFAHDGSQFDQLFRDGERFRIGQLKARVMHTPGHTPACVTYVVEEASRLPPSSATRCSCPTTAPHAATFLAAMRACCSAPSMPCWRCQPMRNSTCATTTSPTAGRCVVTTVAEEREANIHVHTGISEDAFVAMRTARDATLDMPILLLPSVQVNMRAGNCRPPKPMACAT
jgi:hypothetical protein